MTFFKRHDTPAEEVASKLAESIAAVYAKLEKEVLKGVGKSLTVITDRGSLTFEGRDSKDRNELFDTVKTEQALKDATEHDLGLYVDDAFSRAVEDVNLNWDDIRSDFDDSISTVLDDSTSKITESVQTVKDELSQLLKDNHDRPASELRTMIEAKFENYTGARAATIARTTTTFATGASQKEAWSTLDIEYAWFSMRDKAVRSAHKDADGSRPDKDGNFHVGGATGPHPGALDSAKQSVNCRCMLRPRPKS